MSFRDPTIIVAGAAGAGFLFLPGRGLMLPAILFGPPRWGLIIPMALVIFCVVYFGVLGLQEAADWRAARETFPRHPGAVSRPPADGGVCPYPDVAVGTICYDNRGWMGKQ
jgi:hypothetical protein